MEELLATCVDCGKQWSLSQLDEAKNHPCWLRKLKKVLADEIKKEGEKNE